MKENPSSCSSEGRIMVPDLRLVMLLKAHDVVTAA